MLCPVTTSTLRLRHAAILPVAALLFLAGCSGASDDDSQESPASESSPTSKAAEPSPTETTEATDEAPAPDHGDAAITCAAVQPLAAPITGSFTFSPDDSSEDSSATTCVWTNDAVREASITLEDYAALGITVDGLSWSVDDLATLPGASDDPRAEALGGRLLLGEGADATTLGEAGSVQVLFPEGSVTVVASGTLLAASPDTQIPVDAVVDVAVQVAELRR